ncbi:MAG: nickel-responsive transcriptional regulator NikR [Candidatus Scalindua sp.]|nr:nickel-responsive transcriptional regulator NikR [Candidatus Scalindua sp.]
MEEIVRFGVSMDLKLLKQFDQYITEKGYGNRSEAIRDLIRNNLVEKEWEVGTGETVGTITIIYNHHKRELTDTLTNIQHKHQASMVSTLHVHLDAHNCLEVLVVKGKASEIKIIADRLIGTKGVMHGKLTTATLGKEFS